MDDAFKRETAQHSASYCIDTGWTGVTFPRAHGNRFGIAQLQVSRESGDGRILSGARLWIDAIGDYWILSWA